MAVRLGWKAAAEIDAMFEEKRRVTGLRYDHRLLADNDNIGAVAKAESSSLGGDRVLSPLSDDQEHPTAPTLSAIYQRYLDDPTRRRCARTMLAHQTTRRVVEDVIGALTPITDITRETCRELFETLRWLPVNSSKIYGHLTTRQAAALGKSEATVRTINPTNINAYMARFASMLNWAVAEEYLHRNPSKGLQLAD